MANGAYTVVARIPSSSNPDKVYEVKEKDGRFSCSCPIWVFNRSGDRTCKHTKAAEQKLGITDNLSKVVWFSDQRKAQKESASKMPQGWVHPLMRKKGVKVTKPTEAAPVVKAVPAAVPTPSPVGVDLINPMLASKGDMLTLLRLYKDPNWVAELKLDGGRYMLYIQAKGGRLFSRHISVKDDQLVEKTNNVPHITGIVAPEHDGTVLDGEITVPGADFGGVISVMGSDSAEAVSKQNSGGRARLTVFDCPRFKGKDVTTLPLRERRKLAEQAVADLGNPDIVMIEQRMENKQEWYQEIVEAGGEGIILKNLDSQYYPGKRGQAWVKVKKHRTFDVVVTGFEDTKSATFAAKGWIGAIKFGVYRGGVLVEIGKTSGMTQAVRDDMSKNPNKYLGQVIEVEGQEVLREGIRHPRYLRLRPDANQVECTWEKLFKS